jgi:serine/threonine-protein kinase
MRIAPSSSDVNELYGRMVLEAGQPERAIAVLGAAASLDPELDMTSGDLLRARAYLGDWSAFEAALEREPRSDAQASIYFFGITRLACWRRDRAAAAVLRAQVEKRTFPLRAEVLRFLDALEGEGFLGTTSDDLANWGGALGRSPRRPMFFRQLVAETRAYQGDLEGTVGSTTSADALGLIDVTWTDRCPLFAPMRGDPRFVQVRNRVAARAREAMDVLEGRVE